MNAKTQLVLVGLVGLLLGLIIGYSVSEWGDGRLDDDRYGRGMMFGEQYDEDEGWWLGHGGMMGDDWFSDRAGEFGGMMGDDYFDGMRTMHDMVVSSEQEFLEQMIPHHQEAVDTAKEVIARGGVTPAVKTLVEGIVVAQEREIADMKQWYQAWYGKEYQDTGAYEPMMRELENLSGAEIDQAFLRDMIMHHMGAIMMARSVQPHVEHEELKKLAVTIAETQSKEIVLMRQLLQ